MSMFDRFKILHGFPKEGQKIKFVRHTKSWFINVEEDQKKLVLDQFYTVRKTEINSSSSYVWLEEFPNIFDPNDPKDGRDQPFFNLSSFEWEKPEIDMNDLIGFNARDICRLNYSYKWGIKIKDFIWAEGDPMLVIDYDDNKIITKAELIKIKL